MLRLSVLILSLLALQACTSSIDIPDWASGTKAQKITKNNYRISYQNKGLNDHEVVQNLILLKAAETTLLTGYTHFSIVQEQRKSLFPHFPKVPNTLNRSTFDISDPSNNNHQLIVHPGQDLLVRVHTLLIGQIVPPNTFDAREVYNSIGPHVLNNLKN